MEVLWRRLVSELAGPEQAEANGAALATLARELDLTGGQIKSAVPTALVRARHDRTPLTRAHLEHAVEREMEKEERGLSER